MIGTLHPWTMHIALWWYLSYQRSWNCRQRHAAGPLHASCQQGLISGEHAVVYSEVTALQEEHSIPGGGYIHNGGVDQVVRTSREGEES